MAERLRRKARDEELEKREQLEKKLEKREAKDEARRSAGHGRDLYDIPI